MLKSCFSEFFNPCYWPFKRCYTFYSDISFVDVSSWIFQLPLWICTLYAKIHHRRSCTRQGYCCNSKVAPSWRASGYRQIFMPAYCWKVFCSSQDEWRQIFMIYCSRWPQLNERVEGGVGKVLLSMYIYVLYSTVNLAGGRFLSDGIILESPLSCPDGTLMECPPSEHPSDISTHMEGPLNIWSTVT
jgi:hypothetical protein